jgi:outer membrane protein assembly factor BamE (lipoprotein component of BamABCDE complex)
MTGFTIARLFATVLLIVALDRHPYGYYTFMRLVVTGVAAYGAVIAHGRANSTWTWVLGIVAVLFNPVLPVYLDREMWAGLDLATAGVLLVSLGARTFRQATKPDHHPQRPAAIPARPTVGSPAVVASSARPRRVSSTRVVLSVLGGVVLLDILVLWILPASRSSVQESHTPANQSAAPFTQTARRFFTVGSTKDEVLAVQGTPTEFTDREWKFGFSRVLFSDLRVAGWNNSTLHPLMVRMLPADPVDDQLEFFTVGSTKDEVLSLHGTPTELTEREWKYGFSSVAFEGGQVVAWDVSTLNPLRVRLLPSAPVLPSRAYFTVGSTKDEVLAVQGTPNELTENVWKYAFSSVFFKDGRVESWRVSPLSPLRVRMK